MFKFKFKNDNIDAMSTINVTSDGDPFKIFEGKQQKWKHSFK